VPRLFAFVFALAVLSAANALVSAQQPTDPAPVAPKENAAKKKDEKKSGTSSKDTKPVTGEQVVESSLFIYGLGGGRATLNQIRKTAIERGKLTVTDAEGKTAQANYSRWVQRGESFDKEKIRFEQEFPSARYSLVFSDARIFGIYNDTVFTPREDAMKAFENQIVHGIEALLRYKENESKVELTSKEKLQGVEYYIVDLSDKEGRKTRYYVSTKTLRVMLLDYDDLGVKYRRRFYDYNFAQGTLVPYRTVLWADDKVVEESEIGTVTFGQKIDENMFSAG
jgi:hypothetical protein